MSKSAKKKKLTGEAQTLAEKALQEARQAAETIKKLRVAFTGDMAGLHPTARGVKRPSDEPEMLDPETARQAAADAAQAAAAAAAQAAADEARAKAEADEAARVAASALQPTNTVVTTERTQG